MTKLCVIGFTGHFYQKETGIQVETEGVRQYLETLDSQFAESIYFGRTGGDDRQNTTPVDIEDERLFPNRDATVFQFALDYIRNLLIIFRNIQRRDTVSLLFLPGPLSLLLGVPVSIMSHRTVLYYMSDPEKLSRNMSDISLLSKVKTTLYIHSNRFLNGRADAILYRDEGVLKYTDERRTITERSQPIISINQADLQTQDDTCQDPPISVLYVGKLSKRKGVDQLIAAFNTIYTALDIEVKLVIVGDGPMMGELLSTAKKNKIKDNVEFKGHIADKDKLLNIYRGADIFVLPSKKEGFPRVLTEAMSQSLPVITTPVGEIPRQIDDSEEALLVSPNSQEDISDAIMQVLNDDELRKSLIKNGHDKSKELVLPSAGDQHAKIIKSVADQ